MRRRSSILLGLFVLLVVLLAAACGGKSGGGGGLSASGGGGIPGGADFAPASAPGFLYVNTDFGGSEWGGLNDLANKFPDKAKLLAMLRQQLQQQGVNFDQDVKPALGPETDAGVLTFQGSTGNAVLATQPKDAAKLDALVRKLDASSSNNPATVTKKVGDWTLASDSQAALAAGSSAHAGSSLAEGATFKAAMSSLPDSSLVKFFLDGASLSSILQRAGSTAVAAGSGPIPGLGKLAWIAGALQGSGDGVRLDLHAKSANGGQTATLYTSKLLSEVPGDALLFTSFNGVGRTLAQLETNPALKRFLPRIEAQLGVSLQELTPLFSREGALYVRQGTPLPEVTLALEESDEQQALATVDRLVAKLGGGAAPKTTTVDGVTLKQLPLGSTFSLYYGAFDGKLVITDSRTAVTGLKDKGSKLSDDDVFKTAKDKAGMGDSTLGFVYVNLKAAIPIVENFAQLQGTQLPPETTKNLEPLQTFLLYGTRDGATTSATGFLGVK